MKLLASMVLCAALLTGVAFAEDKTIGIAVSSNALEPAKELALLFEKKHPVRVSISSGSSGKLYAQIRQGAPYQIFLAADDTYTALLETEGLVATKGRFRYAKGTLVIWRRAKDANAPLKDMTFLKDPSIKRVAIANPDTAPYGRAAIEAMKRSGMFDDVKKKLVYGESVAQAFGFAATGNADAAMAPLSIVYGKNGEYFIVRDDYHSPIIQEAALLKNASQEAKEFFEFLKSKEAADVFKKYGYLKP
ncbi:MAG: molybdate ABC transporter substrate-binding protein [Thermodesulfobacteriota bacterium]